MSMSFGIGLMISGLIFEIIGWHSNNIIAIILGITMILGGILTTVIQEAELKEDIRELKEEIRELKKKIK